MDMTSVDEVILTADPQQWRPGDTWLAGGTVLFSYGTDVTHGRPQRLLDITDAGWPAITWHDDALELAATCRIAELYALPRRLDDAPDWARTAPGLALLQACCDAFVASWKIWNMSTVGGNVATALPAGPMISLLCGLDATARILAPDGTEREEAVSALVTGPTRTSLRDGELLRAFRIPATALAQPVALRRMSLTERGRSSVLLIGRRVGPGRLRIAVTASVPAPLMIELGDAAAATIAGWHSELEAALDRSAGRDGWHDDVHGSPEWRAAMTHRLGAEIVAELLPDSSGASAIHGRVTGDLRLLGERS